MQLIWVDHFQAKIFSEKGKTVHICKPALGKLRQEECLKFEDNLGYTVSSRPSKSTV